MILFGCLLAFGAAVAPRVILILAWIFSDRWARVWGGDFLIPLLGIIFLPYTTIMYMLAVTVSPAPGGGFDTSIEGFAWIWILLGLLLDFMKWGQMITNRRAGQEYATHYYPEGAPGSSTIKSMSSSSATATAAPSSTSATTAGGAAMGDGGAADAGSSAEADKGSGSGGSG